MVTLARDGQEMNIPEDTRKVQSFSLLCTRIVEQNMSSAADETTLCLSCPINQELMVLCH